MDAATLVHIIADGAVIPIAVIATITLLIAVPNRDKLATYSRILMAGLTSYLVAELVASVYQPASERPFELLGVAPGALYLNNAGFPSDHALFVAVLTLAVWCTTRNKPVTIILTILTLVVCIGRVVALVHTPLDVAAGLLIALIGALWYVKPRKHIAK